MPEAIQAGSKKKKIKVNVGTVTLVIFMLVVFVETI